MSINSLEATPTTSSTLSRTADRQTPLSNRGRRPPRQRSGPRGITVSGPILTSDRVSQQSSNTSSQRRLQRQTLGHSNLVENASETEGPRQEKEHSDVELCFICGNSMKERYYSLAPCNNAFCHNCSLRLRSLYKSTNCPFCKVLSTFSYC